MHTLYPPISVKKKDDDDDGDDDVLSHELREHFDTMRALQISSQQEANNKNNDDDNAKCGAKTTQVAVQADKKNPDRSFIAASDGKKRKSDEVEEAAEVSSPTSDARDTTTTSVSNDEQIHMQAVRTALAVESEISHLQNGIAELEALLASSAGQDHALTNFNNHYDHLIPMADDTEEEEQDDDNDEPHDVYEDDTSDE